WRRPADRPGIHSRRRRGGTARRPCAQRAGPELAPPNTTQEVSMLVAKYSFQFHRHQEQCQRRRSASSARQTPAAGSTRLENHRSIHAREPARGRVILRENLQHAFGPWTLAWMFLQVVQLMGKDDQVEISRLNQADQ